MRPIEQIEADIKRTWALYKRRSKAAEEAHEQGVKLEEEMQRARVAALKGQPGAVVVRIRGRNKQLDDAVGTIVEVRRTRCTVDFGEHGRWNFHLENLLPATEKDRQGWMMFAG